MPDRTYTVLFYAQDNKGLGHVNCSLTIAGGCAGY